MPRAPDQRRRRVPLRLKLDLAEVWRRPSALVLVAVNFMPLYGVLFRGWDPFQILLVYWTESLILGLLNLPRMLLSGGGDAPVFGRLFLCGFFTVHYGLFMFVHLAFLVSFGSSGHFSPEHLPRIVTHFISSHPSMLWAVGGLAASHLFSFISNDLVRGELKDRVPGETMFSPYGRIFVMQFVILLGGILLTFLGSPTILVALLVLLKIPLDLTLHLQEHAPREEILVTAADSSEPPLAGEHPSTTPLRRK